MNKQEELREAIGLYTDDRCLYLSKGCVWCSKEGYCASGNDAYTCLMKRLTELGVVIKVDRELPENPNNRFGLPALLNPQDERESNIAFLSYKRCQDDIKDAGFEAVVPLIKEG